MTISNIRYNFEYNCIDILGPYKIIRENDKSYFIDELPFGYNRFPKNEIGKTLLKAPTQSSYLSLTLIDATEEELINGLCEWFINKANDIKNKKGEFSYGI
jgi:hypothetical protein